MNIKNQYNVYYLYLQLSIIVNHYIHLNIILKILHLKVH